MCVVSPDSMFCAALVLKPSQSTHTGWGVLGSEGNGRESGGPTTSCAYLSLEHVNLRHAVLKSASNTWDNVRGPPVWVSVMTKRGARWTRFAPRLCSDQTLSPCGTGAAQMTPVFELPHGRKQARLCDHYLWKGARMEAKDERHIDGQAKRRTSDV